MTAIEVLAIIFAILVLAKMGFLFLAPKKWMNLPRTISRNRGLAFVIYLISAIIVGYFILNKFSIVEIAAMMLFLSLLMGLSYLAFADFMNKIVDQVEKGMAKNKCGTYLMFLLWALFALWILYEVGI